jgi:hypothetical protein
MDLIQEFAGEMSGANADHEKAEKEKQAQSRR